MCGIQFHARNRQKNYEEKPFLSWGISSLHEKGSIFPFPPSSLTHNPRGKNLAKSPFSMGGGRVSFLGLCCGGGGGGVVCHSKEVLTFFCALDHFFRFPKCATAFPLFLRKGEQGWGTYGPRSDFFLFPSFLYGKMGGGGSSELSQSLLVFFSLVPYSVRWGPTLPHCIIGGRLQRETIEIREIASTFSGKKTSSRIHGITFC